MNRSLKVILASSLALVAVGICAVVVLVWFDPRPDLRLEGGRLQSILRASEELAQKKNHQPVDSIDKTDWPPEIAALSPQLVRLDCSQNTPFIDIQLSGGFYHAGLLVVCDPRSGDFIPFKSNWKVERLAPQVFSYKE